MGHFDFFRRMKERKSKRGNRIYGWSWKKEEKINLAIFKKKGLIWLSINFISSQIPKKKVNLAKYKFKFIIKLIGRSEEKKIFEHCLKSSESKLIALYGRRRVGKTFLVWQYFGAKIIFEVSGLHKGSLRDQLTHFASTLVKYGWAVLYKLVDNFTIFYLKFMQLTTNTRRDWNNTSKSQSWKSWSGLAFERLCFQHIPQIKRALKLEAIESAVYPWAMTDEEGTQIDMPLDRTDRIVQCLWNKITQSRFFNW